MMLTTQTGTDAESKQENRPRIELALFQLGYRNQPPGALISTTVLLMLVFGYGDSLPRPALWFWFGWMLAVEAIGMLNRWIAWRGMRRGAAPHAVARTWRKIYLWQLVLGGVGWGNLGLLYTGSATLNAVLLVVFFGVASLGSILSAAHHYRAMVCAMPPALILQAAYLPHGFGERASALQAMLMVYLLLLIYSGRNIHRNILENIRLRFENEDIMRQKAAEAERADKANLDKSHFLAAASHDLRQPVHALLLLVAAMRQHCSDGPRRELIDHIQQAGQAIVRMFNALMELSRLESGAEVPEPQPVAVAELLAQIVARHLPEAEQKGVRLGLAVSATMSRLQIHTDRLMFGRILDNLVSNALRYTPKGRVLVTLRARAGAILLDVWDTGIGIAAADTARIFEPYVQIGNAERDRDKGLGLGLAIVRQTSRLLGCPVDVASVPGRGSRFRLDIGHLRIDDLPRGDCIQEKTAMLPHLQGRRVLVVDDDRMVQRAMTLLLASWQADVRTARDAEEALACADGGAWAPDCILCDFRLPGALNGIDLLNRLTEAFPHALAILQTGELNPAVHTEAEDEGYLLLKKPVSAELLAATLSGCMPALACAPGAASRPDAPATGRPELKCAS